MKPRFLSAFKRFTDLHAKAVLPLFTIIKAFLRYLGRRRSLSLLQLLGIACGTAAVIGMILSARTALQSFTDAVAFLQGEATHTMERPAGSIDENVLLQLLHDRDVVRFSPVIDRRLKLEDKSQIRLLGIDPFLDREIRPEFARSFFTRKNTDNKTGALDFLLDEKAVFIEAGLASQRGIVPEGEIKTSKGAFRVIGLFSNPSGEPLILMDISHAQKLFALPGRVDHVDLILSDEAGFVGRWDKGFKIQSKKQQRETFTAMVGAFRLNLEAMSLMALFVAVFLIYNTTMFTVVSRKKDAGILRSIGATRRETLTAFFVEIMILGVLGGALGGALGYLLSLLLTNIVGGAISNLYFFLRPAPPVWSFQVVFAGILLGVAASLLGGIYPLWELARSNPVEALRGRSPSRSSSRDARRAAYVGIVVMSVGVVIFLFSGSHVYAAFAATFAFLLGASLLTGVIIILAGPLLKRLLVLAGGLPGRMAAGNIRQNLGRSGVAVAAFMIALSMSIGLDAMIGSFRESLIWWMGTQLRGDLYISTAAETEVPVDFFEELLADKRIDGLDAYRRAEIDFRGKTAYIAAIRAPVLKRFARFAWLSGGNENWDEVIRGAVAVSESFVRNFNIKPGDTITLDGNSGPVRLKVAASFYDYSTEHGLIIMDRSAYLALYNDPEINSLSLFFEPSNSARQKVIEEVRQKAQARGLPVFTQKQLYSNVLDVFDSTFAVTRSMKIMAIIIAFFGVAGALMTLFIERRREFGILRSLGFSTGQVSAMTLLEALGMGVASFLISAVVGTIFSYILIKVINLRSFNWTIFFYFRWQPYAIAAATALAASLAASLYPIWKVKKTYPQIQIREE